MKSFASESDLVTLVRRSRKHVEEIARLHLDHIAGKQLTNPAKRDDYLGVPAEGPYKPDHYRY